MLPYAHMAAVSEKIRRILGKPRSIVRLAVFRALFGLILLWEIAEFFRLDRIERTYVEPAFHFKYFGFSWVNPLPSPLLHALFAGLLILAAFICVGFMYRTSIILFFLGYTYVFLLDQAAYFYNHIYLYCLISFLLIFVPAAAAYSVDAYLAPRKRALFAPAWTMIVFQFQLCVVYFFAGLAKANVDWLSGFPIETRLLPDAEKFPLSFVLKFVDLHDFSVFLSYGGLLFDVTIAPLLLFKKTRLAACVAAAAFHVANFFLFDVGSFPAFGLAATLCFFLPETAFERLSRPQAVSGAKHAKDAAFEGRKIHAGALAAYAFVQIFLPLRHWLYPGEVRWTDEGFRFSWRMILDVTRADMRFYVVDARTGESGRVDLSRYLADWQKEEMSVRPDMILQFAHYLGREAEKAGDRIEIRVDGMVSLDGRPPAPLINSNVDLTKEKRTLAHSRWILPLPDNAPDDARERMRNWTVGGR